MNSYLLDDREAYLIDLLRDIRRAFPNGYQALAAEAQEQFEWFLDLPREEDEEE